MEKIFYESRPYLQALAAIVLPLNHGANSPVLLGSCALLLYASLYVIKIRLEYRALAAPHSRQRPQ